MGLNENLWQLLLNETINLARCDGPQLKPIGLASMKPS
jgi:hypothetical protein